MPIPDPLDRLRDAINSHDPLRIAGCFTTDYHGETPQRPAENVVGSAAVARNWTAIFARHSDLHARVLRHAVAGPEIWSEWEMTATESSSAPTLLCGPVVMTTRDGRIAWARFYLGPVAPTPATTPPD